MKPNIGLIDSLVRIIISLTVIGLGLHYDAWWGFLGLCPLVTFMFRWSLLYHLFGINTWEKEARFFRRDTSHS